MVCGLYDDAKIYANYCIALKVKYIVYDEDNNIIKPIQRKYGHKIYMVSKLRNWEEVKKLFDVEL